MLQKNNSIYYHPKVAAAKIVFVAIQNLVKNNYMGIDMISRCK